MKYPRMTEPTQRVLRELLEDPAAEKYGLEICKAVQLAPGSVHPILYRFEKLGWLESRFEEIDPSDEGRPRRRYYRLTPDGAEFAREALARVRKPQRQEARLRPALAGGAAWRLAAGVRPRLSGGAA
ncbi:MAG TPA: helix-turn-helix transcriptional regulator [Pseudonocardiaceae bacterium]|nr:helix-turn-helix transcriptional regulator [Pseudonocardiaceae bacterium]